MEPDSTYPLLVAENPAIISLADYPLDVVLLILNLIFRPLQIITIDITGPQYRDFVELSAAEVDSIGRRTKVLLQPPPLYALASVCRLFQQMYRQAHPTAWGAHLHRGLAYHIDLARDIFHVRLHRHVAYWEWDRDGQPLLDPLAGVLAGVQRLATSVNYVNGFVGPAVWAVSYLRHLHPECTELMFLAPMRGLEKRGGLGLVPALELLGDDAEIWDGDDAREWAEYKRDILFKLRTNVQPFENPASDEEREQWAGSWRLCPLPKVTGYAVDELRLCDPEAWELVKL